MRIRGAAFGLALLAQIAAATDIMAQTEAGAQPDQPVLFKADRLRNEQNVGLVVANGNVEFTQGARTLLADTVTYNRRTDMVTASGNVSLLEPTGEVVFADHVELTGDLRTGIIENIRVRLSDDSRIAASAGRRTGGNRTEFRKGVYSACKPCEENPESAPIWQVKATDITHDQTTQDVEYRDAFLEFYGIPILYTPYISHPDPTVKRRSGFLVPTYGSDSELGLLVQTPYYIDIAPNMDATFMPIFTTDEGAVAAGEFRHRLRDGEYDISGSITHASRDGSDSDQVRGHVRGELRYDIDPTWRAGADLFLASDDTYLRRYGFESPDTLENRLFAEGFRGRNYAAANAYYFQGQRADDVSGETPIVFPLLDYNHVGEPGVHGELWKLDANLLALTRTDDTSTYRASVTPQWELPYTSNSGEIYRVFASVQADAYWVNDLEEIDAPDNTISGATGRFFPQAGVDWRLPLARTEGRYTQIVEPMLGLIVAPSAQNHELIPNEDSLSFEFDDTNLFSANRFSGLDRVEGGPRLTYGLHSGIFGLRGGFSSFFVGQSYRFIKPDEFGAGTGLEDRFSDFVGRVRINPTRYLSALYRFRLDKDDLSPVRNELQASVGAPAFQIDLNYLSVKQQDIVDNLNPDDNFDDREELTIGLSSQVTRRWQFGVSTQQDLSDGGGSLRHGAFLFYRDDCFEFRADYQRTFTQDRDIRPSDTIYFRFVLRTLGEFQTQTGASF